MYLRQNLWYLPLHKNLGHLGHFSNDFILVHQQSQGKSHGAVLTKLGVVRGVSNVVTYVIGTRHWSDMTVTSWPSGSLHPSLSHSLNSKSQGKGNDAHWQIVMPHLHPESAWCYYFSSPKITATYLVTWKSRKTNDPSRPREAWRARGSRKPRPPIFTRLSSVKSRWSGSSRVSSSPRHPRVAFITWWGWTCYKPMGGILGLGWGSWSNFYEVKPKGLGTLIPALNHMAMVSGSSDLAVKEAARAQPQGCPQKEPTPSISHTNILILQTKGSPREVQAFGPLATS